MESIWQQNTGSYKKNYPPLEKDLIVDAAVIGGGLSGVLTAYHLQKCGIETVLLEAETIGSGATGYTTAKITADHRLIYHRLLNQLGQEQARLYANANQSAIDAFEEIIKSEHIDCDFERLPCYTYSTDDSFVIEQEHVAASVLGLPVTLVDEIELPIEIKKAIRYDQQAQFHPLKFLYQLAGRLKIYEHTPIAKVKKNILYTTKGVAVTAKFVVITTHYPFVNIPGYYFTRMHQERSYVLGLSQVPKLNAMYVEAAQNGITLRSYGDTLIAAKGSHRTGENTSGGYYQALLEETAALFPDAVELCRWSNQDCTTLDGLPYIGKYSLFTPNMYLATGYQEWGMTMSMTAARLLTDLITKTPNPLEHLFLPKRPDEFTAFKNFRDELRHATHNLVSRRLKKTALHLDDLKPGHGGVVDQNGELLGAYRDEEGKVYLVPLHCPHLGCLLTWNPDELSWDCPCHGTRLDIHGNIISNPAVVDPLHEYENRLES